MSFRAIPAAVDLPAVEHEILKFWRDNEIFEKTLAAREGAPAWMFYEGPPTANAPPGLHHLEARTFKDILKRGTGKKVQAREKKRGTKRKAKQMILILCIKKAILNVIICQR